jgi:hypothetical protein
MMTIHQLPTTGTSPASCASSLPASCRLPETLEAPARARRFVHDSLCHDHGVDARAAAELVASEMVTHALLYGRPPFVIEVECRTWDIRLTVTDGGTDNREVTDQADQLRVLLLEKIARNGGAAVTSHGKTRWYDIPTGLFPGPRRRSWRGTADRPV